MVDPAAAAKRLAEIESVIGYVREEISALDSAIATLKEIAANTRRALAEKPSRSGASSGAG
jgi:hypothetical protein